MKQRIPIGQRINNWLDEPEGSIFKNGKWRFWFPILLIFSVLNAVITAYIFGSAGKLQTYIGVVMLSVSAVVAWSCIGALHYSDSKNAKLARDVSILDSFTLCFVIAHFCFLLWAQGHLMTLQSAEADYKAQAEAYNAKTEKLSSDNVEIEKARAQIATETTKTAKLQNDTAYQLRRAAETGNASRARAGLGIVTSSAPASSDSLAKIELEKPKAPEQSSAAFLMQWDSWIRAANFGELILMAITFIFIRNRSAQFNAQSVTSTNGMQSVNDPFPSEIDANEVEGSSRARDGRPSLVSRHNGKETTRVATQATRVATQAQKLREYLKEISFYHSGYSFKVDLKSDYVWIRMVRAESGREQTIASTKAAMTILDDVERMKPDAFRLRLATFLKKRDFPIDSMARAF